MKNKLIVFGILFSLTTLVSCKKYLDKEPLSAGTDLNFWKNENEGNSAVAGGYALVRQALTDGFAHFSYGDLPTDEFSMTHRYEDMTSVSSMAWNISVPSTSTYRPMYKLRRYDNFYRIIDQAARCIKFIPTIPASGFSSDNAEASRNNLIGEAYFLRAFAYFYMARVWGTVPIVVATTTELKETVNLENSTELQVLEQARADVNEAIAKLSWTYSNVNDKAVRANKGAAYALLAHLEAWAGNYEACAAAASQVIENGGYQYVPMANYLSIWKGQSPESIFEIAANSITEGSALSIASLTLKGDYLKSYTDPTTQTQLNSANLLSKFPDSSDLRIQHAFAFYASTDPNCIKYSNITYLSTNANVTQGTPLAQNNIVVFRLSDIVLLKAEALAATGNYTEAKGLLDQIKNKAKPGDSYKGSNGDMFEEIMDERGRELFLEGHRFYDLVRLAKAREVYEFGTERMDANSFKAGKYHWPFDPTLITLNPRLQQTAYWKDKM